MLHLERVAELHLSAASGLVAARDALWVVADDEHALDAYAFDGQRLERVTLFAEPLPDEHAARKRAKADLEALAALPDGRVLALGSGSTPARMRGACIDPVTRDVQLVDLAPLYQALLRDLPELNVEGATIVGDALWLAQRGNGPARVNALCTLDLSCALAELGRGVLTPASLRDVREVALGELDGVALSFTDLTTAPDGGVWFSAAAEDVASTYEDGDTLGSVLGTLDAAGNARVRAALEPRCKIEGIAFAGPHRLWLVADPDDRGLRAPLYRAVLDAS